MAWYDNLGTYAPDFSAIPMDSGASSFDASSFFPTMDLGNSGTYSMPSNYDYTPQVSDYSSWTMPSYSTPEYSFGSPVSLPDIATGVDQPFYTPSGDGTSQSGSMLDQLKGWALEHPDRAVGAGMGVLGGLGNMMNAFASNKYAKKVAKRNDRLAAYEQQQMARNQKNQALADSYNNSIDKTTPNTVTTNFSQDPSYYEHYGEMTGGKTPFVTVTPGTTERVQLAGGGMPELTRQQQQDIGYHPEALLPNLGFLGYLAHIGKGLYSNSPEEKPKGLSIDRAINGGFSDLMRKHNQDIEDATNYASGGAVNNFVSGGAMSGQGDTVPAMLSDGEYVMDADTVAALGDGNSKAGAGALDQMRQNIRTHKRSGSVKTIPPKAKPAEQYLPKKGRK